MSRASLGRASDTMLGHHSALGSVQWFPVAHCTGEAVQVQGVHCSGPPPLWNYLCWYTTLVTQTHPLQTPRDTVSCQSGPGAGKEAETVAAWNLWLLFPLNMFLIYYTYIIISSDETKYITYLHNRWSKGFIHYIYLIPWIFRLE